MNFNQRELNWLTAVIGTLFFCCCSCGEATDEWDYLVFTQAWPVTLCIEHAENRTDPTEECIFPENVLQWTIHGLWPNRFDGNNPSFCNRSVAFDENKIRDIEERLDKYWPNLLRDKTAISLWKHEWEKHGTCALHFEPLNDERKYFAKGLYLYAIYNATALLPSLNIFPDKKKRYSTSFIFDAIRNAFSKTPYLECVEKGESGIYDLLEMRLCFNKEFELVDCAPGHVVNSHYHSIKCPPNSFIIYPKNVISRKDDIKKETTANSRHYHYITDDGAVQENTFGNG